MTVPVRVRATATQWWGNGGVRVNDTTQCNSEGDGDVMVPVGVRVTVQTAEDSSALSLPRLPQLQTQ